MKMVRKYLNVILLIMLFGCNVNHNKKFILNSVGKEWRLDRVNNKKPHSLSVIYLVFYKNGTYDLYYKKRNGEKHKYSTDIPVESKWFFDKENNLHIANFDRMGMNIIRLDNKHLIFEWNVGLSDKDKFSFVCDDCE